MSEVKVDTLLRVELVAVLDKVSENVQPAAWEQIRKRNPNPFAGMQLRKNGGGTIATKDLPEEFGDFRQQVGHGKKSQKPPRQLKRLADQVEGQVGTMVMSAVRHAKKQKVGKDSAESQVVREPPLPLDFPLFARFMVLDVPAATAHIGTILMLHPHCCSLDEYDNNPSWWSSVQGAGYKVVLPCAPWRHEPWRKMEKGARAGEDGPFNRSWFHYPDSTAAQDGLTMAETSAALDETFLRKFRAELGPTGVLYICGESQGGVQAVHLAQTCSTRINGVMALVAHAPCTIKKQGDNDAFKELLVKKQTEVNADVPFLFWNFVGKNGDRPMQGHKTDWSHDFFSDGVFHYGALGRPSMRALKKLGYRVKRVHNEGSDHWGKKANSNMFVDMLAELQAAAATENSQDSL